MTSPGQASGQPVIDRITELRDADQAYVARLVALTHPEVAESALVGLAEYRRLHPDEARVLLGAGPPPTELTPDDRDLIARAREIGPTLRASNSDRDRLAGWLLAELTNLAEHLVGER